MLLSYISMSYDVLQEASFYHRHWIKYTMLDMPCSSIKKRVSNMVVGAINLPENLKSALTTTQ